MNRGSSPGPKWRSLFHGAVRESLAAVNSVARIDIQDTNAWESPIRYVVDDNQGSVGVIEFRSDGAIAAMNARAPARAFDRTRAINLAPAVLRDDLSRLCELPLLQHGLGPSAIFWTVGELIHGPESWDDMCMNGSDLFERELLSDSEWQERGIEYYDLTQEVGRLAIRAAARAMVRVPILRLTENEFRLLVPKGSEHEGVAVELLTSKGLFEVAPLRLTNDNMP